MNVLIFSISSEEQEHKLFNKLNLSVLTKGCEILNNTEIYKNPHWYLPNPSNFNNKSLWNDNKRKHNVMKQIEENMAKSEKWAAIR